jgi:hypothetical protein
MVEVPLGFAKGTYEMTFRYGTYKGKRKYLVPSRVILYIRFEKYKLTAYKKLFQDNWHF